MRISDASYSYSVSNLLQKIKSDETELNKQLVSGKRIDEVADDASLSNTILLSQTEREKLVQLNANSQLADSTAGAGIEALEHIQEIDELALVMAETGMEDTSVADSIDGLITDLLATANEKYGDESLFAGLDGSASTAPFTYDAANGHYVYNGSGEGRSFEVSEGVSVSPFAGSEASQAILSSLNSLVAMRNAIAAGDTDAISSAMDSLQTADDSIVDASSELGIVQSRLAILDARNAAKYSNYDNAEEIATSADENETTVKLLAAQNAYSAALQSAAKILDTTLLDYI